MQDYVAGFVREGNKILLIEKNRPNWQKGLLNGVGGKIEPDEHPYDAFVREVEEEAGINIHHTILRAIVMGNDFRVFFYISTAYENQKIKQLTDEKLFWIPIEDVANHEVIPNLKWLVPLCFDTHMDGPLTFWDNCGEY